MTVMSMYKNIGGLRQWIKYRRRGMDDERGVKEEIKESIK